MDGFNGNEMDKGSMEGQMEIRKEVTRRSSGVDQVVKG